KAKTKEKKSGVIYLSRVPTCMNVKQVCEMLSQYGAIGRVFLKPDVKYNKKNRVFEEGWIEFERKKVAKLVAFTLNNKPIGGKRRSPWFHELWNLKYLKGFKWTHLNEKLTYERAVRKQKLKLEISKAKKETDKFAAKVEKQRKSK
ncbi:hypothetical protein HELRODRAFT_125522, partial [Helobdella robusta]|uniref:Activator of basal transcription 1 n=1 Tax=Helobdella robusta TaxID=6412 RepID=T1EH64_HELRO